MSELMRSLIAHYEMGMIINASPGVDLCWIGDRIQTHSMIQDEHVWIEQNEELDRFVIGFGRPGAGDWLTEQQAKQLLLDHFGGAE